MLSLSLSKRLLINMGLAVSLSLWSNEPHAQTQLGQGITFSGFGTIAAAKSNSDVPVLEAREITDEWCLDCDTTFGVQFDWLISTSLRSTLQVLKRPQDTFSDPEIERAFIEFSHGNARIKVGRLRTPMYIMSEYYYVSHAYPWLRLPPDVYASNLGITHYDGATADISFMVGEESQLSITPFISLPSEEVYEQYGQTFTLDVNRAFGLSSELYYEDNLLRFAYVNAQVTQSFSVISETEYNIDMFAIGLSHYFGQLHFQSEAMFADELSSNWYAGFDYQFGEVVPYIQYGQSRRRIESNTYLLGFRYNWTDRISSSMEWQHIQGEEKVLNGHFVLPQNPQSSITSKVDLFSLGLSFTF